MNQCKNNLFLKIQAISKTKNDLFDYVSSDIQQETLSINKECFIIKGEKIYLHHTPYTLFQDQIAVGRLSCTKYFFNFETYYNDEEMKEKAWLPIRQFSARKKDEHYALHQGDFLKIGQIELKVRSIQIEGEKHNPITLPLTNSKDKAIHQALENGSKKVCRICFCNEEQVQSPLINPCHCSGGIKYIHLSCLHQWLKTNEIIRSSTNEHCITYTYKKISCELCKAVFPDIIQNGEAYYEIWNFVEPPYKSYVILETSLPSSIVEGHSQYKTIFIVNFDAKNRITIGRSRDCDLRIKDVSVSRIHSELLLASQGTVSIVDLNSKFGTIVLLQNRKMPIYTVPLTVQFGRHMLTMWMKPSFSITACIACGDKSLFKPVNYNRLNSEQISLAKSFSVKKRSSFDEVDPKTNIITQENDSINNNNNSNEHSSSHSSIEEDAENEHINNNSYHISNKNQRYLEAKASMTSSKKSERRKRLSIPLVMSPPNSSKKYKVDMEKSFYTKDVQMKSMRLKSKTKFHEDQQ